MLTIILRILIVMCAARCQVLIHDDESMLASASVEKATTEAFANDVQGMDEPKRKRRKLMLNAPKRKLAGDC
jgi:hypothetical protein